MLERRRRRPARDIGIPGFDGDVRYDNPGIPTIGVTGFAGLGKGGTNWYQFDTTFQMSNVLSWTKGTHNIRTGFDVRKMATGRRAANNPRGVFSFNGVMTGYPVADFMTGVPVTVTTPVDQVQGHVGQWRNGFFINDVWQATREHDAQPRAALRAQHAGADLRRLRVDAQRRPDGDHPGDVPGRRASSSTSRTRRTGRPRLGATYRLSEKTVLRGRLGHLLQPQPDELVHVPDEQPADRRRSSPSATTPPTRRCRSISRSAWSGRAGRPNMITPNRAPAERAEEPVERRHPARDRRRHRRSSCSTSASRTTNLDRSFFNNTPVPGPGGIDARRPNQRFREIRTIANDLIADYDR